MYKIGDVVFGNWTIAGNLGSGSFGSVYEIQRRDFGETYRAALKVISVPHDRAELMSLAAEGMSREDIRRYYQGSVEELVREFSIMAKLKATGNVVSYEDHMVIPHKDGIGWDILIRMELLHPVLQYAKTHPFSRRDVISLGIDMCRALELCQKYNIIHRDIKPENIFVSDNGDFKLGDFGIARTIESTMSGLSKKGTYSYMAPEVYSGGDYGFSVDTYSLGIVLYRLLNRNRTPFLPMPPEPITVQNREAALARRMSGARIPMPYYASGRLGEIVLKACAFDPRDRYSSPMQMRQELEAVLYSETDASLIYPKGDVLPVRTNDYADSDARQDRRKAPPMPVWKEKQPEDPTWREPVKEEPVQVEVPAQPEKRKVWIPIVIVLVLALIGGGGALLLGQRNEARTIQRYEAYMHQAAQIREQDPQQALDCYVAAIALRPEEEEAYIAAAYTYYLAGQYDTCVSYIENDLAMGKEYSLEGQNQLNEIQGAAYFEMGDYAAAAAFFRLSAAGGAITETAMRDYAVSLGRLGDIAAADEILGQMIQAGAKDDVTAYVQGEIHYAQLKYLEAETAFRKTLDTAQDLSLQRRALRSLAEVYRACSALDRRDASPVADPAIKGAQLLSDGIARYGLQYDTTLMEMMGLAWFDAYYAQGDRTCLENAADAFRQVIDQGMVKDYLFTNLYTIYYELGDYDQADGVLTEFAEVFSASYVPYALRTVLLVTVEGDKDNAQRDYSQAVAAYNEAKRLLRSSDDQTYFQQAESLMIQLDENGWI